MRFLHLSDLHIGKRLMEYDLLDDQRHVLWQILGYAKSKKPDAVVIAGDVYDRSVPPAEAVDLFDDFLTELAGLVAHVMIISGNHDSPERLGFGGRIMASSGVHFAGAFKGAPEKVALSDEYGEADFWLLPFVRPGEVKRRRGAEDVGSYDAAARLALDGAGLDSSVRNVLVAHQFVTRAGKALTSESETVSVGGQDNVDFSAFDAFDYAALGHLHTPQSVGRNEVRYAGSILKYSASEISREKTVSLVELKEKGNVEIVELPLVPLHDVRAIKGPLDRLLSKDNLAEIPRDDYIYVTLTDDDEPVEALGRLREAFPNFLKLEFDNARTRGGADALTIDKVENKDELTLFKEFYENQSGEELDGERLKIVEQAIERAAREDGR